MHAIDKVREALDRVLLWCLKKFFARQQIDELKLQPEEVTRVLVIPKFASLSRVISGTPIVQTLRGRYPNAVVSIVVSSQFASLFDDTRTGFEVITLDYPLFGSWWGAKRFYRCLHSLRQPFDLVLVLDFDGHGLKQAILGRLSRSLQVVGVLDERVEFPYAFLYNHQIATKPKHASAQKCKTIGKYLGAREFFSSVELKVAPGEMQEGIDFLRSHGVDEHGLVVGFQVDSNCRADCWPPEKFVQVAKYLSATKGATIAVFRSARTGVSQQFIDGLPFQPIDLCDKPVAFEAAFLNLCDAVICSDLDFVYLAASQRCPLVWLTYDSKSRIRKPSAQAFKILQSTSKNFDAIESEQVTQAVEELLARHPKAIEFTSDLDISERALDEYLDFGDIKEPRKL